MQFEKVFASSSTVPSSTATVDQATQPQTTAVPANNKPGKVAKQNSATSEPWANSGQYHATAYRSNILHCSRQFQPPPPFNPRPTKDEQTFGVRMFFGLKYVDELEPIENHLRNETLFEPIDGSLVVVRGGPFSIEKFVAHILRQSREYSYLGQPMTSLSVSVTSNEWDLERLLAGPPQLEVYIRHSIRSSNPGCRAFAPPNIRTAALRPNPPRLQNKYP